MVSFSPDVYSSRKRCSVIGLREAEESGWLWEDIVKLLALRDVYRVVGAVKAAMGLSRAPFAAFAAPTRTLLLLRAQLHTQRSQRVFKLGHLRFKCRDAINQYGFAIQF